MSDTRLEKEDTRQWFLRTGGETVFGPVSTDGLIVWAEQGRVLPGHEVSTDRKKWVQAVSLEMLEMRWYVDDGSGELRGPLNKLAAEALIKSGKAGPNAQLVAADDVETPASGPSAGEAASAHDPVPEDVLRVRIRELEALVSGQRERLAKLSNTDAIETVQHERDVLASLVKDLEGQRDAILKNAEKDMRASERKLEQMRQQVKKLEQQLEEAHNRLQLAEQALSGQATEASDREAAVVLEHERELAELRRRLAELEQTEAFHERRADEIAKALVERETELSAARVRAEEAESARDRAERLAQAAVARAKDAETSFAELLDAANARDAANRDRIAALEKACALSPEETERFYSDRAAVYDLVKDEIDELSKALESERAYLEQLKELGVQRQQAMIERKQTLLKQLGSSPTDMTRRASREQPADPNAARLRTEFDNLRVAHERDMRQAQERERELQRKLRVLEAEAGKLRAQAVEGEKLGRRLQEITEVLRKREQELADERKNREAERGQFTGSQQALLARLDSLERSSRPGTPDEMQAADARSVKLPGWMRLKK